MNHPNIAQVYGLEESGGTTAIAMELVDGETLSDVFRRGPIDVSNALRIAKDMAEGLESAHEKGIVHRDLKPTNVKLTEQGGVKVLDFGLAKPFRSAQAAPPATGTALGPNPATAEGMILGTRGYMSPEQVRGAPTDHRSDVFSFGCVLYEMLAGERAFGVGTSPEVEPSVLGAEPDLAKLPRSINPRIPDLIARCVEKDPRRRWQAIGDVRIELETILTDPHGREVRHAPARRAPLWKRAVPLLAAAMVTGGIVAVLVGGRPTPPQQTTRFKVDLGPGQGFTEHGRHIIAVSPDGTHIAFVANDQLMVRDMADPAPRRLPVSHWDLSNPLFSPDGRWIAFFAGRKLQKIALSGGAPLEICDVVNPFTGAALFGASWAPDNHVLLGRGPRGIQRVSANGGEPETVLTVNAGEVAHGPQLLPDGDHVLFTLATDEPGSER